MTRSTGEGAMTVPAIQMRLRTRAFGRRLHLLDEVGSTNEQALALLQQGEPDGTTVVADRQTAGRGRQGRSWHSPPGRNLYFSVILRRRVARRQLASWLPWVPLVSALAVARAVEAGTGLRPSLKWPNDLLLGARKVGGLLCESGALSSEEPAVVVGVGLNVNQPADAFPAELRDIATSLAVEAGQSFDRATLLAALLNELEPTQDRLLGPESRSVRDEYRTRCATLGRLVQVTLAGGESLVGSAEALGDDGALVVRPEGGEAVEVRAADITHLR
jgi:BirA family biotin operon repressor/biotin-[acetyl-CoA-carboxylase] ligase